jgi:hypothetical protein
MSTNADNGARPCKGTVDLKLDGMQSRRRIAVMLGDEATSVRLVAANRVSEGPQGLSTVSATTPTQLVP